MFFYPRWLKICLIMIHTMKAWVSMISPWVLCSRLLFRIFLLPLLLQPTEHIRVYELFRCLVTAVFYTFISILTVLCFDKWYFNPGRLATYQNYTVGDSVLPFSVKNVTLLQTHCRFNSTKVWITKCQL